MLLSFLRRKRQGKLASEPHIQRHPQLWRHAPVLPPILGDPTHDPPPPPPPELLVLKWDWEDMYGHENDVIWTTDAEWHEEEEGGRKELFTEGRAALFRPKYTDIFTSSLVPKPTF
jgi:hypothetical protein